MPLAATDLRHPTTRYGRGRGPHLLMAAAELLQGEDLEELRAYLASVCPAVLGLAGEGELSAKAFREALTTPDASALLSM